MNPVYDNEGLRVQSAPGCHLCQTPGELLYANLRDRLFGVRGVWNILRCPLCGLVWLDPRPSAEEIGQLYAEYHTHTATDGALHTLSRLRKGAERAILGTAYAYRGLATASTFVGWPLAGGGWGHRDVARWLLAWATPGCWLWERPIPSSDATIRVGSNGCGA